MIMFLNLWSLWFWNRSYKNGFVWHDLSEDDLIYPAHGHDYILKGSELPENAFLDVGSPPPPTAAARRRNQSCGSIDIYSKSADVSTQTDDNRRRRRCRGEENDCKELHRVEIEISTPPSDSSPETLGTLIKANGQARHRPETMPAAIGAHRHDHIQRCRSSVLMQLISCGSLPFKDCGAGGGGQKTRAAPRGEGVKVKVEEKEYFSGSLVETKQREVPQMLKRSSSYSAADRWVLHLLYVSFSPTSYPLFFTPSLSVSDFCTVTSHDIFFCLHLILVFIIFGGTYIYFLHGNITPIKFFTVFVFFMPRTYLSFIVFCLH